MSSVTLAARLWFFSALAMSVGIFAYFIITGDAGEIFFMLLVSFIATALVTLPAFLVLLFVFPLINKLIATFSLRITTLLLVLFLISCFYGVGLAALFFFDSSSGSVFNSYIASLGLSTACAFAAATTAFLLI